MSNKFAATLRCVLVALPLLCTIGNQLHAQTTNTCPIPNSLEFPLWSDGTGWNQPNAYNSIQMADIDGDGEQELLGSGPSGVEVWHWDRSGQAWVQMTAAGPTIRSTDTMMTADVDGDGQAEIIQISATSSIPVLNVWHYDGGPFSTPQGASAACGTIAPLSGGQGIWRLEPQLKLNLAASSQATGAALTPLVRFTALSGSGRQQQLVQMVVNGLGPTLHLMPVVWQVNAGSTGWTSISQGPNLNTGISASDSEYPISFHIGDVNGDGLPDLVTLQTSTTSLVNGSVVSESSSFVVFTQKPPSSSGQVSFASGPPLSSPTQGILYGPNFVLADALGLGYNQLIATEYYNYTPAQDLKALQYTPSGLTQQGVVQSVPMNAIFFGSVPTGLNGVNPKASSLFILNSDGLDEWGNNQTASLRISNTPLITPTRFGDSASHYSTIQTGRVFTTSGALQTVIVARDAGGIHTLLPSPAGTICGSSLPGFQVSNHFYFPPFTTSGTAAAYSDLSQLASGTADIRSQYAENAANAQNYANTIQHATYQQNGTFSQCDLTKVQAQLLTEVNAVSEVNTYMNARKSDIDDIFSVESTAFNNIILALNLPTDYSLQGPLQNLALNLPLQAIYAGLEFAGNANIPVFSQAAEAISVISEIITDVQQTTAASCGIGCSQLVLSDQLTSWKNSSDKQIATEKDKVLENYDLLETLSQQINTGSLLSNAVSSDDAIHATEKSFEIGTWQALTPAVWDINVNASLPGDIGNMAPSGYPYQYTTVVNRSNCGIFGISENFTYQLYPEIASTVSTFGTFSPVAQQTIQELINLGVDWHGILANRNGWNIPHDFEREAANNTCVTGYVPNVPPSPPTSSGNTTQPAPGKLVLLTGGGLSHTSYACNGTDTNELTQSTPINSVFPNSFEIQVQSLGGDPVPNASVQITGQGLSPLTSTVTTDNSGYANFQLLANGIIQGPYPVTLTILSPAKDPNATTCSIAGQYQLQNTPRIASGTYDPAGLQAVVQVISKAPANSSNPNLRQWNLKIIDPTGTAVGGSIAGSLTQTMGSASCRASQLYSGSFLTPVIDPSTGQSTGAFTAALSWDFEGCTGLNLFTLNIFGEFIYPLDGATYHVNFSAKTNNQTP